MLTGVLPYVGSECEVVAPAPPGVVTHAGLFTDQRSWRSGGGATATAAGLLHRACAHRDDLFDVAFAEHQVAAGLRRGDLTAAGLAAQGGFVPAEPLGGVFRAVVPG